MPTQIDAENGTISVFNNGQGIPIEKTTPDMLGSDDKSLEGIYVPELIFGHLLTSSNYDDDEKKTTGGRNGYGAKLANIISTEFIVETSDSKRGLKYRQVFNNNMKDKQPPTIAKCKEDWTKITFTPDLKRFGMHDGLDEDVLALFTKRVYDMAACTDRSVKVSLNGPADDQADRGGGAPRAQGDGGGGR